MLCRRCQPIAKAVPCLHPLAPLTYIKGDKTEPIGVTDLTATGRRGPTFPHDLGGDSLGDFRETAPVAQERKD